MTSATALLAFSLLSTAPQYSATVLRVIDGDTLQVFVPAWGGTPFSTIDVRVFGIDTPESHKPPAKCVTEVRRGKIAISYARTLIAPGMTVTLGYRGWDKYGGRIDADVSLPDGRDFGTLMITGGLAAIYHGGKKQNWCRR